MSRNCFYTHACFFAFFMVPSKYNINRQENPPDLCILPDLKGRKTVKKTIAFLLTLILILSLGSPALAFSVRLSAQNLTVDGNAVECEKYNIDGSNYFKLRDIAYVLNGTGSQFSVGWDSGTKTVSIVTGEEYVPDGSELILSGDKSETAVESSQTIQINGEIRSDLTVYNIGGSNFFKLRDLGDALGFEVDYDKETNTAIVRSASEPEADGRVDLTAGNVTEYFDINVSMYSTKDTEKNSAGLDQKYTMGYFTGTVTPKQTIRSIEDVEIVLNVTWRCTGGILKEETDYKSFEMTLKPDPETFSVGEIHRTQMEVICTFATTYDHYELALDNWKIQSVTGKIEADEAAPLEQPEFVSVTRDNFSRFFDTGIDLQTSMTFNETDQVASGFFTVTVSPKNTVAGIDYVTALLELEWDAEGVPDDVLHEPVLVAVSLRLSAATLSCTESFTRTYTMKRDDEFNDVKIYVKSWRIVEACGRLIAGEEPVPEPAEDAFSYLARQAKENGEEGGGNYLYNFENVQLDGRMMQFSLVYAPEDDQITLMNSIHSDDVDQVIGVVVPRSLSSPYYGALSLGMEGDEYFGSVSVDAKTFTLGSVLTFDTTDFPDALKASAADMLSTGLQVVLAVTQRDLLLPNGYTLKDIGFLNFPVDETAPAADPSPEPAPGNGPEKEPAPVPSVDAFSFLVKQTKEKGRLSDAKYVYTIASRQGEKDGTGMTCAIIYESDKDDLVFVFYFTRAEFNGATILTIPRSMAAPYSGAIQVSYTGDKKINDEFGSVKVDPKTYVENGELSFAYSELSISSKSTFAQLCSAGITSALGTAESELLLPNGYSLKDLGFTKLGGKEEEAPAAPQGGNGGDQAQDEVIVYSPENFAYKISRSELEQHLGWGYSTEPQELAFGASGAFGGATKTSWKRSGRTLLINDQGVSADSSTDPAQTPASQFTVKPDLYSVFIVRGSTKYICDLKGSETIGRVEIADTVTSIKVTFETCVVKRIGIPASVTSISISGISKKSLVIYGEAGSYAEKIAKDNEIRFVPATILYGSDGRTVMVSSEERPWYLGHGWYSEPVITMYAADGRTKNVPMSRVAENAAVGWYERYEDVYTTLYALDGRTKDVLKINVAAEEAVGWYTLAHYNCAVADQMVESEGFNAAVAFLREKMSHGGDDAAVYGEKVNQLLQAWMQEIGCPVAILRYEMGANSIGTPEVTIYVRNLTQKTINRIDITWTCRDAYGNVTTDYPTLYNGDFTGYTKASETIGPGEPAAFTWTLYSNVQTAYISNYYVESVAFTDGTSWRK